MNKEDYTKITKEKLNNNSKELMLEQINNYYKPKEYVLFRVKYIKNA